MTSRVLVVDDSEVTRAILARTLRGAGFEVLEARDGAEGALTALRERPSLVVTDLEMPTMDGFPLLRMLKADPLCAHIPVLILTSHTEPASRFWSLRTGADGYLTKDHRPHELVATVRRLVEAAADLASRAPEVSAPGPVLGPLEVLARVARQLDASLLQATVVNTLLEKGMAAADFHAAGRAALETLGEIVDARFLAVAVAELETALVEILLQDPLAPEDVEAIRDSLLRRLRLIPGTAVEARIGGEPGRERVDLERMVWIPLSLRGAEGGLALLPRDPDQYRLASAERLSGCLRPLILVLDNARLSHRLHEMSTVDGLTRQLNHRAIYERLTEEMERTRRYKTPLSVVLCDLDEFKEVNDTHGHLAGDLVLRESAAVLRHGLRSTDILGRYGGEEFLAVLPQSDLDAALLAAERLRRGLAENTVRVPSGATVRVSASFGVATWDDSTVSADLLVSQADRRLYDAKAAGRNCVRPAAEGEA
ncbi:MAG TPA: diguanylate cyclase [Thermoanaerobaculia bacterium]|nr:diguanylate cyclase [Thermoanaerobaculia bacterium]